MAEPSFTSSSSSPLAHLFAETERNLASIHAGHFSSHSPHHSHHHSASTDFHITEHKEAMQLPLPTSSRLPPSSAAPPPALPPPSSPSSLTDADYKLEAFSLLLSSLRTSLRSDLSLLSSSVHRKTSTLRAQLAEFTEERVREAEERVTAEWEAKEVQRELDLGEWRRAVEAQLKEAEQRLEEGQWRTRARKEELERSVKAVERSMKETKAKVDLLERRREERPAGAAGGVEGGAVDREVRKLRDELMALQERHCADVAEVRKEAEERGLTLHSLLHDLRGVVDGLMAKEEKEWERRRDEREERKAAIQADIKGHVKAELSDLWTTVRDAKRRALSAEERVRDADKRFEEVELQLAQRPREGEGRGQVKQGSGDIKQVEEMLRSNEERWVERERADRLRAEEEEQQWDQRAERLRLRMEREWAVKLQAQGMEIEALKLQLRKKPSPNPALPAVNRRGEDTSGWDEEDEAGGNQEDATGSDATPMAVRQSAEGEAFSGVSRVLARAEQRVSALEERLHEVDSACKADLRQAQTAWAAHQRDGKGWADEAELREREAERQRKQSAELSQRQVEVEANLRALSERVRSTEDAASGEKMTQQRRWEDERRALQDQLREVKAEVDDCRKQLSAAARPVERTTAREHDETVHGEVKAVEERVDAVEAAMHRRQTQLDGATADLRQQLQLYSQEAQGRLSALQSTVTQLQGRLQALESRQIEPLQAQPLPTTQTHPSPSAAVTSPSNAYAEQLLSSPSIPTRPPIPPSDVARPHHPPLTVPSTSTRPAAPALADAAAPQASVTEKDERWDEDVEEELVVESGSSDEEAEEGSDGEDDVADDAEHRGGRQTEADETPERMQRVDAAAQRRAEAERAEAEKRQRVIAVANKKAEEEVARARQKQAELQEQQRLKAEQEGAQNRKLKTLEEERLREAQAKVQLAEAERRQRAEEEAKTSLAAEEQRRLSRVAEQRQQLPAERSPQQAAAKSAAQPQRTSVTPESAAPPARNRPPISILASASASSSASSSSSDDDQEEEAEASSTAAPQLSRAGGSQGLQLPSALSSGRQSRLVSSLGSRSPAMASPAFISPSLSSASPSVAAARSPLLTAGLRSAAPTTHPTAAAGVRHAASAGRDELDDFDLDLDLDDADFLDTSKDDDFA